MAERTRKELLGAPDEFKASSNNTKDVDNRAAIKKELERLEKKGSFNNNDLNELMKKYPNEDVMNIYNHYKAKIYSRIRKQAQKAAQKVHRKFSDGNRPLHEILKRMMKFKVQNGWSDLEYDTFRKELAYLLTGQRPYEIEYNQNIPAYRTRINKTLGSMRVETGEMNISDSEHAVLAQILSSYEKSLPLYRNVFMHGLTYNDCSLVAMTGEYKRDRHDANNHIHPLIACLFLPKFEILETHMLQSNFGNIIKCRYEKKPILYTPDQLLFYDISYDPNDVVCEINSPLADLYNRFKVQINLWETVLKLRQGHYYDCMPMNNFMSALDACRNNLYDNADLAFSRDEGSILRRLLSVFSLRPTIIYTKPLQSLAALTAPCGGFGALMASNANANANGFGANVPFSSYPFNSQPVYTITQIPMVTLQIPPYTLGAEPKDIRTATTQTIWINENKTIVPKEQTIIYSKELIIFYVNRHIQRVQIRTFTNPIPFSQMPMSMSGFERLNPYPINVPAALTLAKSEEIYQLRSVVCVTQTEIQQGNTKTSIITGSTGLIMTHRDFNKSVFEPVYYLYDPWGASIPVRHPEIDSGKKDTDGYVLNKPISFIEPYFSVHNPETGINNLSFFDRASTTGTVYIYAKASGYNPQEIISV